LRQKHRRNTSQESTATFLAYTVMNRYLYPWQITTHDDSSKQQKIGNLSILYVTCVL